VLDRPDPITGYHVEGPVLDPKNESFVGYFPMPIRHGMTLGELARMFNSENKIAADLTIVPMTGWQRSDWFDATGQRWVNPSPNLRSLPAAVLYPGVAMLEYSEDYSVGRGTDTPFEVIGAKWLNGNKLADYLNARDIPGVRAYPISMKPASSHLAGTEIDGVRFVVTDRDDVDSELLGLEVAGALIKLYPGKIKLDVNRRLIGSDQVISRLEKGDDPRDICRDDEAELYKFLETRQGYLLYQ